MRVNWAVTQRRLMLVVFGSILAAALALGEGPRAASDVVPTVAIVSPASGQEVGPDRLDVVVSFAASAHDPNTPTGNVTLVVLALDGARVGGFVNPPGTKSGTHTFGVDLGAVAGGQHELVATAYQGEPSAGHAGTSAPVTIHVVRPDRTPPTIVARVEPAPGPSGWHTVAPLVTFDAQDAESGLAFVTAPVRVTADGADQVVTGTARDVAGNEASASVTVSVDTTAPTLTVLAPASGSTVVGSAVTVQGAARDDTSGLDAVTCDGAAATVSGETFSCPTTSTPGSHTVTVRASDRAGNVSTAVVGFTLVSPAPLAAPAAGGATVAAVADVSVTTTVSPASAASGEQVTYTIMARNAGPGRATGVVVTTSLGSALDFVSVATTSGSCSGTTAVRCDLGALAPGASSTVTLVAQVRGGDGVVSSVGVAAAEADPDRANNLSSAAIAVTVRAAPAPPPPVQGVYAVASPVNGTVLVNGRPLADAARIAIGSTIDARKGKVELQTTTSRGVFSAGQFRLRQGRARGSAPELTLIADVARACRATSARALAANEKPKKVVARLWGQTKSRFTTKARYSSATVRGTVWLTVERCDGSLTSVRTGTVSVADLVTGKTVILRAGKSYLARPRSR